MTDKTKPNTLDLMAAIKAAYPDATPADIKASLTPEFLAAAYGKMPGWSTLERPVLHDVKAATVGSFAICYGMDTSASATRGEPVMVLVKRGDKGPNGEDRYGTLGGYTNLGGNTSAGEQPKVGAAREIREEATDDTGNPVISPNPSRLKRLDMEQSIDYRNPKLPVHFNPHSLELNAQELALLKRHSERLRDDPSYKAAVLQKSEGEVADLRVVPLSEVLKMDRNNFTHPHEYDAVKLVAEMLKQKVITRE